MSDSSLHAPVITPEKRRTYLERRQTDLKTLQEALSAQAFGPIQEVAHRIKGSARTYGFPLFESICAELENLALQENQLDCENQIAAFEMLLTSELQKK